VRELRERRGITAERRLPPSGDNISGLIAPEKSSGDHDRLQFLKEWIAEMRVIEQRCVPARYRQSAKWSDFISACVLFDPPRAEDLDAFTRHGDLRHMNREAHGARGGRAIRFRGRTRAAG
jgi:hypothetical protein